MPLAISSTRNCRTATRSESTADDGANSLAVIPFGRTQVLPVFSGPLNIVFHERANVFMAGSGIGCELSSITDGRASLFQNRWLAMSIRRASFMTGANRFSGQSPFQPLSLKYLTWITCLLVNLPVCEPSAA